MATKQRSKRAATPVRPQSQRPARNTADPVRRARPVLVATDGSAAAAAAIRFARAMEEDGAWAPQAMTAIEHLPVAVADVALPAPVVVAEPFFLESQLSNVQRHLRRLGGKGWLLRSEVGPAPASIVDHARIHEAEVIVLGLGKHGKLARLFGAETATRVIRKAGVPVLAVDQHAKGRPRSIVVAMDFGASSIRAAREALDLLAPGGRLHLVHVRWALDGHTLRDATWERTYAMGVEQGFVRMLGQLVRDGITVTTELKLGGVLESMLHAIKERKADVVALGSHSQTVVDRLILGSTPANLLRAAKTSVLVAPAS